ncbi:MAG: hypothetical protein ACOX8N_08105, partial [Christensenellales bacterium]
MSSSTMRADARAPCSVFTMPKHRSSRPEGAHTARVCMWMPSPPKATMPETSTSLVVMSAESAATRAQPVVISTPPATTACAAALFRPASEVSGEYSHTSASITPVTFNN